MTQMTIIIISKNAPADAPPIMTGRLSVEGSSTTDLPEPISEDFNWDAPVGVKDSFYFYA